MVISPERRGDQMVWVGTTNEVYSVRSGYHLESSMLEREAGTCSNNSYIIEFWREVWNVRGPTVVLMFLWNACHNILPTRENLYRRGILQDPLRLICWLETESLGHTLWSCASAQDVWLEYELQFFSVSARQIWHCRNIVVQGEVLTSLAAVVRAAQEQVQAHNQDLLDRQVGVTSRVRPIDNTWQKPPEGYVKINWDAAVDTPRKRMGMGIIAKDHEGKTLATLSSTQRYIMDPATTEAIGCRSRVTLHHNSYLEGDGTRALVGEEARDPGGCSQHSQQRRKMDGWLWGNGARDENPAVQIVGMEGASYNKELKGNSVAHCLAKLAFTLCQEHIWLENFPSCINELVLDRQVSH
ncbi:uncharacterized protein LOC132170149 [Corylus avellana]|uniref:uncharacterized protein LOC132170149 n=1 Tax=Corylus avellana TaxID=13451 RepID=UPI00286BF333|nr:uncharacterized protein LOC132170149 [Corylus avellana]